MSAPELTQDERAVVERFEAAPYPMEVAAVSGPAALSRYANGLRRVLGEMDEFDTRRPTLGLVVEDLDQQAHLLRLRTATP